MRAKEFLAELANRPYPFKKNMSGDIYLFPVIDSTNPYDLSATSGEQQYLVGFSRYKDETTVNFQEYPTKNENNIFALTGMRDSVKVLSTVAAIINAYIETHLPKKLYFITSKSQRRKEFYDQITPKLSRWIKGYTLQNVTEFPDDPTYGRYDLVRDDLEDKEPIEETGGADAPTYPITVVQEPGKWVGGEKYLYEFRDEEDRNYDVHVYSFEHNVHIQFGIKTPEGHYRVDPIGSQKQPLRVLNTIKKALDRVMKIADPAAVEFTTSDNKLIRLYDRVAKRFSQWYPQYTQVTKTEMEPDSENSYTLYSFERRYR